MIVGLLVLFVGLIVLAVLVPVLGIVAIIGGGVLLAVFALSLVARLAGGTWRFGFGLSQTVLGLIIAAVGLLLLLGVFGALSLAVLRLWPLLLIFFGLWWLFGRR